MTTISTERLTLDSVFDRQRQLERSAQLDGMARFDRARTNAIEQGRGSQLSSVARLMTHWFDPLRHVIDCEKDQIHQGHAAEARHIYGPLLVRIPTTVVAAITMSTAMNALVASPGGVPRTKMARLIGTAATAYIAERVLKADHPKQHELIRRMRRAPDASTIHWIMNKTVGQRAFSQPEKVHLGACLLSALADTACAGDYMEDVWEPAFVFDSIWRGHKSHVEVVLADRVWNTIEADDDFRRQRCAKYLPMIIEPFPWTDEKNGGYVDIRLPYVRVTTPAQRAWRDAHDVSHQLAGSNALQSAGRYRTNTSVLDVAKGAWDNGGGFAGLPSRSDRPLPPRLTDDASEEDIKLNRRLISGIKKWNRANKNRRAVTLNTLAAASMYDGPLWFPWRSDFRGRHYAIPTDWNNQRDDLARSLLLWDEPVPLTEVGERCLYIHAANMFGHDKLPIDERIAWTASVKDRMIDAAKDPVGSVEWWAGADGGGKAWRFLACCFAMADPWVAERLPYEIDGCVNGMQHYAMMLRDLDAARMVNLVNTEGHTDAYLRLTGRCRPVFESHKWDRVRDVADVVSNRKTTIKPVFMPQFYGLTLSGARSVVRHCIRAHTGEPRSDELNRLVNEITGIILREARAMAPSVFAAMDWLRDCARRMVDAGEKPRWVNPIGWPVLQDYRSVRKVSIKTVLGSMLLRDRREDQPLDRMKHVNAMAPQVNHSIDAAHKARIAIACHNQAMAMSGNHDSFATHMEHGVRLQRITLNELIEVHREPFLQSLHRQWSEEMPHVKLQEPPFTGTLNIEDVRDSVYGFL